MAETDRVERGPRAWLRGKWLAIRDEAATPGLIGLGVGVGVFWGCSPFYGLQTALGLATAFLFRLNKIAVLTGTQISFPPLIPFLVFAELQVGEFLLHRRALPMSIDQVRSASREFLLQTLLADFVVGSLVVSVVVGAALGYGTTLLVRRQRKLRG